MAQEHGSLHLEEESGHDSENNYDSSGQILIDVNDGLEQINEDNHAVPAMNAQANGLQAPDEHRSIPQEACGQTKDERSSSSSSSIEVIDGEDFQIQVKSEQQILKEQIGEQRYDEDGTCVDSKSSTESSLSDSDCSSEDQSLTGQNDLKDLQELKLPKSGKNITMSWLSKILGLRNKIRRVSTSKRRGNENTYDIKVESSDCQVYQLTIRTISTFDISRFQRKAEFHKEVEFYGKICTNMQKLEQFIPIQKCYFAAEEIDASMLVLEDLSKMNFFQLNETKNLGLTDVKLALEQISKFHALGFALKTNSTDSLTEKYNICSKNQFKVDGISSLQKAGEMCIEYMQQYGMEEEHMNELINYVNSNRLEDRALKLIKPKEPIATVCHGNLCSANILFCPTENKVIFAGLDSYIYSHPVIDVIPMLFAYTNRQQRKIHLIYILFVYFKSLQENLNKLEVKILNRYTFKNFVDDYRDRLEYAFLIGLKLLLPACQDAVEEDFERRSWRGNKNKKVRFALQRLYEIILDMIETNSFKA